MKIENYIFTGFGYSTGKYRITNRDISDAIDKGFLQGFSKDKIAKNEKYKAYKNLHPQADPLDYFAGEIMGFRERHYVTPFPPTAKKLYYSETSLELCIKAVEKALVSAKIQGSDIDAWFVSTVSPHEQAPGIAASVKSHFVEFSNNCPTYSLASGCAGFNINLECAINFLKTNKDAKNVVVAHTETMSSFLTQRTKFVPFVTFGDASSAIIISKVYDDNKYGIINIINKQDLKMLDFVGVDHKRNLYMTDVVIKDRAIENIYDSSYECLKNSDWDIDDVDLVVPHQTGNVIIFNATKRLGIDSKKVFIEAQQKYGNTSGTTVPISLSMLAEQNKLKDKIKIISSVAGVGGNYGAFTYIHKNIDKGNEGYSLHANEFKNKNVLILGASGKIGLKTAYELKSRGANLWLHANTRKDVLSDFEHDKIFTADFRNIQEVNNFINSIISSNVEFDYFINLTESIIENECFTVNFTAPIKIINAILPQISQSLLILGTAAEDINVLEKHDEWVSSKRAFHGYLATASGELLKRGIRAIYLQTAWADEGISEKIDEKTIFKFMISVSQKEKLTTSKISEIIANSLYLPKVINVKYVYENAMLVGKVGYNIEVDI